MITPDALAAILIPWAFPDGANGESATGSLVENLPGACLAKMVEWFGVLEELQCSGTEAPTC